MADHDELVCLAAEALCKQHGIDPVELANVSSFSPAPSINADAEAVVAAIEPVMERAKAVASAESVAAFAAKNGRDFDAVQAWADSETARANEAERRVAAARVEIRELEDHVSELQAQDERNLADMAELERQVKAARAEGWDEGYKAGNLLGFLPDELHFESDKTKVDVDYFVDDKLENGYFETSDETNPYRTEES